jgi:hypothetical protein
MLCNMPHISALEQRVQFKLYVGICLFVMVKGHLLHMVMTAFCFKFAYVGIIRFSRGCLAHRLFKFFKLFFGFGTVFGVVSHKL